MSATKDQATGERKPRQGSAYGKVIDRVAFPANVFQWPLKLKEADIWCGTIIGSRVEKSDGESKVVVTLECHDGVIADGVYLDWLRLAEKEAHVIGRDAFLVKPTSEKSNMRRVVQDRVIGTKAGTTRLATVDRVSSREIPNGPADLPALAAIGTQCKRCDYKAIPTGPENSLRQCPLCETWYGPGSGAKNEALPMIRRER